MAAIMVTNVGQIKKAVRLVKAHGKPARLRNDIGNAVRVTYDKRYGEYYVTEICDYDDTEALENTPCSDARDAVETIAYMLLD